ncbi:MAG TPA: PIN domain-containing protein [Candidatus Acidoferrales bacterium]|nr:PIN domain-containing protein [Candidatus Acidoferrales bacterium]
MDVNALVALSFLQHEFHYRVATWVQALASRGALEVVTCSITELGFVRVLAQASEYGLTVSQARSVLARLKAEGDLKFSFIADDHDASRLPGWAKTPRQTTDGHLAELARAHGATLATLDRRIPGAHLIPPGK